MKQLPTDDILQTAKRKAKYGHRDWIYRRDLNGKQYADVANLKSLEDAMLNVDTDLSCVVLCANSGCGMLLDKEIITNMINYIKYNFA